MADRHSDARSSARRSDRASNAPSNLSGSTIAATFDGFAHPPASATSSRHTARPSQTGQSVQLPYRGTPPASSAAPSHYSETAAQTTARLQAARSQPPSSAGGRGQPSAAPSRAESNATARQTAPYAGSVTPSHSVSQVGGGDRHSQRSGPPGSQMARSIAEGSGAGGSRVQGPPSVAPTQHGGGAAPPPHSAQPSASGVGGLQQEYYSPGSVSHSASRRGPASGYVDDQRPAQSGGRGPVPDKTTTRTTAGQKLVAATIPKGSEKNATEFRVGKNQTGSISRSAHQFPAAKDAVKEELRLKYPEDKVREIKKKADEYYLREEKELSSSEKKKAGKLDRVYRKAAEKAEKKVMRL